jgi:hypothetical protein
MSVENPHTPKNESSRNTLTTGSPESIEENPPSAPEQITQPTIESTHKLKNEFSSISLEKINEEKSKEILSTTRIQGESYLEKELTTGFLDEKGLAPSIQIQNGEENISFSSAPFEALDGRLCVIAYVENKGVTTARTYYRSNSQGVWRYLPDYTSNNNGVDWFGKGAGEESITLPFSMQKALSELSIEKSVPISVDDADLAFAGTTSKYGKWNNDYYHETIEKPERLEGNLYSNDDTKKVAPENLIISVEQSPDFSSMLTGWNQNTNMYGSISMEVFPSKDGKLKYMFCRDEKGRTWIGGIENDSEIQSTGLHKSWVEGGDLVTPPFEYKTGKTDQTGGYGNDKLRNGSYVDMYENYISKIPVVNEYIKSYSERQSLEKIEKDRMDGLNTVQKRLGLSSEIVAVAESIEEKLESKDERNATESIENTSESKEKKQSSESTNSGKSEIIASPLKNKNSKSSKANSPLLKATKEAGWTVGSLAGLGAGAWATTAGATALVSGSPVLVGAGSLAGLSGAGVTFMGLLGIGFGLYAARNLIKDSPALWNEIKGAASRIATGKKGGGGHAAPAAKGKKKAADSHGGGHAPSGGGH